MSNPLWLHRLQPSRLFCPWDYPGKKLEWVAISFSIGSSQPRDQRFISCKWILYHWTTWDRQCFLKVSQESSSPPSSCSKLFLHPLNLFPPLCFLMQSNLPLPSARPTHQTCLVGTWPPPAESHLHQRWADARSSSRFRPRGELRSGFLRGAAFSSAFWIRFPNNRWSGFLVNLTISCRSVIWARCSRLCGQRWAAPWNELLQGPWGPDRRPCSRPPSLWRTAVSSEFQHASSAAEPFSGGRLSARAGLCGFVPTGNY